MRGGLWHITCSITQSYKDTKAQKSNKVVSNTYQPSAISGKHSQDLLNLNLNSGMAKMMMDKIVDYKEREQVLDQACNEQWDQQIQQHLDTFNRCRQMTVWVAFNAGDVCLSDGRGHQQARIERELAASNKWKEEQDKIQRKVDAIREKSTDPTEWNASELLTMVAWFKRPGESNILKQKQKLLQCYLLTCKCTEHECIHLKEGSKLQLMMQTKEVTPIRSYQQKLLLIVMKGASLRPDPSVDFSIIVCSKNYEVWC
jgi:hypothetical protein